jgi:hypothetical protein
MAVVPEISKEAAVLSDMRPDVQHAVDLKPIEHAQQVRG